MKISIMKWYLGLLALLLIWGLEADPGLAGAETLRNVTTGTKDVERKAQNSGAWLVSIFRDYVSAVDGDRCPSAPTCSSFGVQAFNKHGLIMGWLMTVDRLIHEGKDEIRVSPLVYENGRLKIYDPVENNDFWWPKPIENPDQ